MRGAARPAAALLLCALLFLCTPTAVRSQTCPPPCEPLDLCRPRECNNGICEVVLVENCCLDDTWCVDNNPCTSDECNLATNRCTREAITCNDNLLCTDDTCDPSTGCKYTPRTCDDFDPCTVDTCNPDDGNCVYSPKDCADTLLCTDDACTPGTGVCTHTPKTCNDGVPCTVDSCDPGTGNCVFPAKSCTDSSLCTDDSCDAGTGDCLNVPKNCADSFLCTIDSCDLGTGSCLNVPKNCDDGNPCTDDSCNDSTGECEHVERNGCCLTSCNDGLRCTTDSCSPTAYNQCVNVHIDYCCEETCSDPDPCINATCTKDTGVCLKPRIDSCCNPNCTDGNICTTDFCEMNGTCSYLPIPGCCVSSNTCKDGDPCTTNSCAANNTCYFTPIPSCCRNNSECTAPDACSLPQCASNVCTFSNLAGCCLTNTQCDDSKVCTTDTCTASHVCSNVQIPTCCSPPCSSNDICITATCTSNTCSYPRIPNCCNNSTECHDNNVCTTNVCTANNTCTFIPIPGCCRNFVDCDDGNPCTTDTCVIPGNSCQHTPVQGCCLSNSECNDNDGCTTDTCTSGRTCSNQFICQCRTNADCVDRTNACNIGKCTPSFDCSFSVDPACCTLDSQCTTLNPCERVACNKVRNVCEVVDTPCVCGDGLCEQEQGELCSTCPDDCGQCEFLVQDAFFDLLDPNSTAGGTAQVLLMSGDAFAGQNGTGRFLALQFDLLPLLQAARAGILVTTGKRVRLTLTLAALPSFGLLSTAPQVYLVDPTLAWSESNASYAGVGEAMTTSASWLPDVPPATWVNLNDSLVNNVTSPTRVVSRADGSYGVDEPINATVLANPPRATWDISAPVRDMLLSEQSLLTLLVSWDNDAAPLLQVVSRESQSYIGMQASVQLFAEPVNSRSGGGHKRRSVVGPVVGGILGGGGGLLLLMGCCLVTVVLVGLVVAGALFVVRRRQERRGSGAFANGSGTWGSAGSGSGSRGGRGVREEMLRMMQVSEEIPFEDLALEKLLGSGAAGDVYLARWSQGKVKVDVAVKRTTDHPADREAFVREVQLVKKLQHPNIVQFLGVSFHGDDLLLVTELMKGGSLEHLLHGRGGRKEQSRALPFGKALRYALDAARGLAFLHFSQPVVIHRDIKPGNLLISESDNVKISDFGISRFLTEMTNTEVGSPAYMAPEMLRNEPYSTSIDVYAFGLTCCEMITGKRPFNDVPATQVVMHVAIKHERPPLPDPGLCPPAFRELITDCWNDEPDKRPAMNVVVERLLAIADAQANGAKSRGSGSSSRSSGSSSAGRGAAVMSPPHAVASASRSAGSSGVSSSSSSASSDSDGSEIEIRS